VQSIAPKGPAPAAFTPGSPARENGCDAARQKIGENMTAPSNKPPEIKIDKITMTMDIKKENHKKHVHGQVIVMVILSILISGGLLEGAVMFSPIF
jgi:hypothetical protein